MMTEEQWDFIEENAKADVNRLRLAYHGNSAIKAAIDQIDCRQRCSKKLHETLERNPRFIFPSVLSAEQSTSDEIASFHAAITVIHPAEDRILDMTCGLGIDSFHFAAVAKCVTAIELNPDIYSCARRNANEMGLENLNVLCGDSSALIKEFSPGEFDAIFIDPARRGDYGQRVFGLAECRPDVVALLPYMLRVAPRIVIKASPMLDISHTVAELGNVSEIIVIGTRNECKELIAICRRESQAEPTRIRAITLEGSNILADFCFSRPEESDISAEYGIPEAGNILYVPYPASVKAGAFKLFSSRFNTQACAPSSHIYFSKHAINDFPGRGYEIIDVFEFNKKGIKRLVSMYKNMDITVRNFPLSADALAAKLKVKPGSDLRLFATRLHDGSPVMLLCDNRG